MSNLENALKELREKRSKAQIEIEKLDQVFWDRVVEWYGCITTAKPTNPNNFRGLTSQNGEGAESAMGERGEAIAASRGGSENNEFGSCQAHHVGGFTEEDRGGCAGEVGEDTGCCEEGGVGGISSLWSLLRRQRGRLSCLKSIAQCGFIFTERETL